MKKMASLTMSVVLLLSVAGPALAVDTSKTYSSGILVGIFLGFCALVVVVQLMPTIMLLVAFIKGLMKGSEKATSRQRSKG